MIRTHDHSVHASEDSSCLRPLGYRDRQDCFTTTKSTTSTTTTTAAAAAAVIVQGIWNPQFGLEEPLEELFSLVITRDGNKVPGLV
jgi:hypothetical protein